MKDFFNLVKSRRSVRNYLDEKIDREIIKKIILAGSWAPSAFNKQSIKYFVLDNPEKIELASQEILRIKKIKKIGKIRELEDPIFYKAPVVVFLCSKDKSDWSNRDAMFSLQNCLLAARELDLGTVAIGMADLLEGKLKVKEKLGMPIDWHIEIAFCLGKTEVFPDAQKRKEIDIKFA